MSTKLYFRTYSSSAALTGTVRGGEDAGLTGTTGPWFSLLFTTNTSSDLVSGTVATVTGPTNGVEYRHSNTFTTRAEWVSPALAADVTISGTITLNLWASEPDVAANAAINAIIERVGPTGAVVSTIAQTSRTTELGTTSAAANFTVSPTSTDMVKGDHIRARVYVDDAAGGNMASGHTVTFAYGVGSDGVDGDSYATFTEDMTFLVTEPTGTTLYLTDTAGPAVGSATEREMWTSRGAGVQSDVVDTTTGPISPLQWTDAAGGSVVEWYSKPLAAFTLTDNASAYVRLQESSASANVGARVELAVCDEDGSNAVVWSALDIHGTSNELTASEASYNVMLAGPPTSVTAGQRLRLRVYLDDSRLATATGFTATLYYAGTSGGASGDSYLILAQSISEYTVPLYTVSPDADVTTTGWTSTPLWSKVDEDPASPDGTVITATAA